MTPDQQRQLNKNLCAAICLGEVDDVRRYLDQGADPDASDTHRGLPALAQAIVPYASVERETRLLIIGALLDAGADPMRPSGANSRSILMRAVEIPHNAEMLEMMLTRSIRPVDPNLADGNGYLPLGLCEDEDNLRVLIRHGADVLKPDGDGIIPMVYFSHFEPKLLNLAAWEGLVVPHIRDGKLDSSTLLETDGTPTGLMQLLQMYHVPRELADPANYHASMDDVARIYPLLPRELQHSIDFSGYHTSMLEQTEDATHIARYERKKPQAQQER